jgi:hypothetical protein
VDPIRVEIDTDFLCADHRIFGGIGYFIGGFVCVIIKKNL